MPTVLLLIVLTAAPQDDLLDAADTFERALSVVGRQPRSCQDALGQNLRQSIRDVRSAAGKRGTTSESVQNLRLFAAGMVLASGLSTCPSQVTDLVSEGVGDLNRAFDGFAAREQVEVVRPSRRRLRDEDDERPAVSLGRVRVTMNTPSSLDGSPAVLLELTRVVFETPGLASFGVVCRSANGRARTEWSTTDAIRVPAGALDSPASFSLRYSTLARADRRLVVLSRLSASRLSVPGSAKPVSALAPKKASTILRASVSLMTPVVMSRAVEVTAASSAFSRLERVIVSCA